MRFAFLLSSCVALALANGAKPEPSKVEPSQPPSGTKEISVDVCSLLTPEEIQAVMGETVAEKRPDGKVAEGFAISQCYFVLPTPSNSVSLRLVAPSEDANARSPREVWKETFARGLGEAQEKRKGPPQAVPGIGDEAYWMGGAETGGLYVLKGNRYFRLGLGGQPNQAQKIEKAKTLARSILKRL